MKRVFMEEMAQIRQILREKSPNYYDKFQQVAKNIEEYFIKTSPKSVS